MNELIAKYEDALKYHDWYYAMSDDDRYYQRGRAQAAEISKLRAEMVAAGLADLAETLYNKYDLWRTSHLAK